MDLLISRSLPAHWTIIPIDGNSRFVSPSLCEQIKRFNYVKSSDDPLVFVFFFQNGCKYNLHFVRVDLFDKYK